MKKKIFAGLAVVAVACCGLAGCSLTPDSNEDGYEFLNEMLKVSYSRIVLTVENDFGEDKLTSVYTMVYGEDAVTVSYSVERFAPLSSAVGPIETKTGTIEIAGGEVTVTEGDDIGLTAAVAALPFDFRAEYFENAELTGGYLLADVKNADAFMGSGTAGIKDVHLETTFFESFFTLGITYTAPLGTVRVGYEFTL